MTYTEPLDRPDASSPMAGVTIVEMIITVSVMIPLLYVLATTTGLVQRSVGANERAADVEHALATTANRLTRLIRAAPLDNFRVRRSMADAWLAPAAGSDYRGVQFANVDPTEPITEIEFVIDPTEQANGVDDDGDGLIDEGALHFRRIGEVQTQILRNVEACSFQVDSRLLRIVLQVGRIDPSTKQVVRGTRRATVFIRN